MGAEIGDGHIMLALSGTLPAAAEATLEELALNPGLARSPHKDASTVTVLAGTGRLHLIVPDVSSAAKRVVRKSRWPAGSLSIPTYRSATG